MYIQKDQYVCFPISFSSLNSFFNRKKTTHILVFLNIHFRILTWNMGYFLCICTIFACWPQIMNFISPNYAQSSVFIQIKYISSLAVWLLLCFLFPSSLTFFLPNFANMHSALCLSALVLVCTCFKPASMDINGRFIV